MRMSSSSPVATDEHDRAAVASGVANADAEPLIAPDDVHNRELLHAVHPKNWINPQPAPCYNLVVVGAGTAGLVSAAGGAGLGGRVALVERGLMGGDCLNVGCVPSKALIRAARVAAEVRRAGDFGIHCGTVDVDFAKIMQRMRRLRAQIAPVDSASRFRQLGVDVFLGHGRFVSPREVEVEGARLRFARAVIATGARAVLPDIEGLAEAGYLTNETIFQLTELPRHLVIIGGGPIACELAQCFACFGGKVTIVEAATTILGKEEPDVATVIGARLAKEGVRVIVEARVERVSAGSGANGQGATRLDAKPSVNTVHVRTADGPITLQADAILLAAGRRPNLDGIGLDAAGVEHKGGGLFVDPYMRTTNRRIYAAGDVASDQQFTHAADAMARLVLRNALFWGRARAGHLIIPRVTFTDPEVASVGLSQASAERAGMELTTFEVPLEEVDRAIVDGETQGFVRIHVKRGRDRIVGATIVASRAGDMIAPVTLAMNRGMGLGALGSAIQPYPTLSLALKQVADRYARTRLTPFLARLFAWILARQRR